MKKSPLRCLVEQYTHKIALSSGGVQEIDQMLRDFLEDALHLDLEATDDIPALHSILIRQ